MKSENCLELLKPEGHSLRGECGLKLLRSAFSNLKVSHSLRGECGLKSNKSNWCLTCSSHSLRGECGLKLLIMCYSGYRISSLSARRVWIEIPIKLCSMLSAPGHSLRGECGLKCSVGTEPPESRWSLSARRVWIEIILLQKKKEMR